MKSRTSICAVDAIIVQENPLLGTVAGNMLDRERDSLYPYYGHAVKPAWVRLPRAVWKMEVLANWMPRHNKNRSHVGPQPPPNLTTTI